MADHTEPPLLDKIRNMWEFAAITQFFYLFFDMFGLDDFDVEVPISPPLPPAFYSSSDTGLVAKLLQ
jgi:hypothetical protein